MATHGRDSICSTEEATELEGMTGFRGTRLSVSLDGSHRSWQYFDMRRAGISIARIECLRPHQYVSIRYCQEEKNRVEGRS